MPTCTNCRQRWTYKQTFKKMNTLNSEMPCPFCGESQYYSNRSRIRLSLLNLLVFLPLLIRLFIDLPASMILISFLILALTVYMLHPFFIELNNKEVTP